MRTLDVALGTKHVLDRNSVAYILYDPSNRYMTPFMRDYICPVVITQAQTRSTQASFVQLEKAKCVLIHDFLKLTVCAKITQFPVKHN